MHEWHEFYLLLGTAGATLVALLFVAVSLAAGSLDQRRANAVRVYMSPVVIHFTDVLFMSAMGLAAVSATLLAAVIAAAAVIGIVVSIFITIRVTKDTAEDVVLFNSLAYGASARAVLMRLFWQLP